MLSHSHNRHESMIMDMDVLAESEPVSRAPSPPPVAVEKVNEAPVKTEPEEVEEKPKKMGNLMKELKQDVTQGAMEFNMDSFF